MVLSIGFIFAFIGAAVSLLIGILVFSEISQGIDCPVTSVANPTGGGSTECEDAKDTAWTVIGILPVALFFALFAIFGALGGRE